MIAKLFTDHPRTVVQLDAEMRGRQPSPEDEEFAYVI